MKIQRRFTEQGKDVFASIEWTKRASKISNLDGSVVFEMNDAEVPSSWSQLATDIMVSKYFRKAGVPQPAEGVEPLESVRQRQYKTDDAGNIVTGPERSAKQVIHRLAGCWTHWAHSHNYFDSDEDASAFYDELSYMMMNQMSAPNSPQWFNTGLQWAYDINGPAQGHYYVDPGSGEVHQSEDAYTHPQPHACFIQSVGDDLVNEGGIMDLWVREARLFKYGSGTGTNFSNVRGENENLSGGGKSSGLMSFLKIGDRAAGAIKSGGTTRRAAKMVCLDMDHPDIEEFVNWKVREEIKVAAMVEGFKRIGMEKAAPEDPETIAQTAERLGLDLTYDFNGETYQTVSGQNSNNSIRITSEFFKQVDEDGQWDLVRRTDGTVAKTISAKKLWEQIGYAAWRCADPGVQFDTTINQWHTCPEGGRINASNPCSEYMFLDNTACNLASLNLLKFYDNKTRHFDVDAFEHATHLWTIVLEISVLMAQFPSKEIAELSYKYRTLGLGYANLGAMLMQAGVPYDSDRARAISGCVTAILCGRSYATSAELARELGAFEQYKKNKKHMLRVIRNHRRAAHGVARDAKTAVGHELGAYEALDISPVPIEFDALTQAEAGVGNLSNVEVLGDRAKQAWDQAYKLGQKHGYRNAQVTVIAPTGTIGLLMDCDTTGVEPDFALVKFKKLAGGGYFKIANQSLRPALESLGLEETQVREVLTYVMGTLHLEVPMPDDATTSFAEVLKDKRLTDEDLEKIKDALPTVFEMAHAFSPWTLGSESMERLGLTEQSQQPSFSLLRALGFTKAQINELGKLVCGTQTVEGAPHLTDAQMPVFDCANKCGPTGERYIAAEGHIRMMAAAQPFISGAISKTINLPHEAEVDDITGAYRLSWELGLKANALYRDGCKLSQPLSNKAEDADDGIEDEEGIEAAKEEVALSVAEAATTSEPEKVKEIVRERVVERPLRRRLQDTRRSYTHKFNVAGHEGYLTVGLYEDGAPGELFITMAKEGSTVGGLMDSLGTAISVALQYGVPVESLVSKFSHQRFEPAGMTHNPDIPFAKSLVDYIFRWMGMQFIPGYRAANAPARGGSSTPEPSIADDPDHALTPARDKADEVAKGLTRPDNGNGNGSAKASIVDAPRRSLSSSAATLTNGNGHAHAEACNTGNCDCDPEADSAETQTQGSTLTQAMKDMQEDAPACDVCGTITVRNGTCYKCLNCGNSMGCS